DPLEARAVDVDHIEIEVASLRVVGVAREDDPLAVGMEVRREAGLAKLRHLTQVRAVAVHDEDLEPRRPPATLLQEPEKVLELNPLGRAAAKHDLLAVRGEERASIRPRPAREPPHVAAVAVHRVDLHVAVAYAGEDDAAVGADRRLGVIAIL